ncbi:DNRLRE domain-containing protein [Conexibacter woesei]|uniref:DNRLRE domain-containing protein n=1 Tax=Conexibacter woesei TaxID=191495 RepID=UPI00041F642A|nr:DNRLRE domain-containing protein [Conexibacter woesei]
MLLVSLLGAVAALLVALVVGAASNADTSSPAVTSTVATPAPVAWEEAPDPGTEVVDRRTADTETFERTDGSFVTRVYPEPVHFRDGSSWRSFDSELVAASADGYLHPRANDGDALIPRDLSDPFALRHDGDWIRFTLDGADEASSAQVDGDTASFDGVAEDTDAAYQAVNDGLRETLTLASPDAPSSITYSFAASADLTPNEQDDGSIAFAGDDGAVAFRIAAPVVWDSTEAVSHAASLRIVPAGDGWKLTLAVDQAWLADPARRFPVTVDPDIYWSGSNLRHHGATQDCTLASGTPTTSQCTNAQLRVGSDASNTYKSLLSFDVRSAIPQDSTVYDSTLLLYQPGTRSQSASNLAVRPVNSSWTNAATWNTRDGSTAWVTPGGDTGTPVGPATSVGSQGYWYYLGVPADTITAWVQGTQPNNGLQLAANTGSPRVTYSFVSTDGSANQWPALDVYWEEDGGARAAYTEDTQRLDDHTQVSVNVANGNLTYTTRDATLAGSSGDLDIAVNRLWQSSASNDYASFGRGWYQNFEQTNLRENTDGSVLVRDETGAAYRFAPGNSAGTFTPPAGLDATLCVIQDTGTSCPRDGVADVKYRLTYNATGRRYYFYNSGLLRAIRDTAGHQLTYAISGQTARISGSGSRQVTLTNNVVNDMATSLSDGTSVSTYLQGGPNNDWLAQSTDANNNVTRYEYNTNGYLTRVSDSQGHDTRIEWQSVPDYGAWRATKITRVLDTAHPADPTRNPTTTYTYSPTTRTTVVTDAAGNATATPTDDGQTTYTYDNALHVTSASPRTSALPPAPAWSPADSQGDTTRPTSTPSGDLYNDGLYVDGRGTTNITLGATDPAASSGGTISGIRRVALEEGDNASQPTASQSTCSDPTSPPRTCPASVSPTLAVDESGLSEGAHHFRQVTQDLAGNTSVSPPWAVNVDRTGPGIVPWFFDDYDDETGTTFISWLPVADPALSGGIPGSGLQSYTYQYAVDGGTWSTPVTTTQPSFAIAGLVSTSRVSLQISTVDNAGNAGAVSTATIAAAKYGFDPTVDDDTDDGDGPAPAAVSGGFSPFAAPLSAYRIHTTWHCSNGDDFVMREGYQNSDGRGFGYQHIRARRGYTSTTDAAIRETLCNPNHAVKHDGGSSYTYLYYYGSTAWRVTYSRQVTRYDGHSKGVITAVPIDSPDDVIVGTP